MTKLLEVKKLNVSIPLSSGVLNAVRDVSFSVDRKRTISLVGESGSGKSLSVLALMRLLPKSANCDAEEIVFDGDNMVEMKDSEISKMRGSKMAMIFQEPMTSLNPCYTIGNQLSEAMLRHQKVSRQEAKDRAIYLLEKVGITSANNRYKQYPHQLSGGLRQRVMIAMGLMCNPQLIIADEPTTALDVTIQAQILSLLASLQDEFDSGMILITHDLGVVARVTDDVAVMYCGQIVETGDSKSLFQNPLHPYTQGLLECIPIPGKTEPGSHLGSIPGIVPTPIGIQTGCVFRNRCPYAMPECADKTVEMNELAPGRSYRCVLDPESSARHFDESRLDG